MTAESETPFLTNNKHYLDQISDFGYYKTTPLIIDDDINNNKTSNLMTILTNSLKMFLLPHKV